MNNPTYVEPVRHRRWISTAVGPSLFEWLFPDAKLIHKVFAAVAFIAFIVVCTKIRFYLPENPTPITLQTFAILATASVMGCTWGFYSVLGYLVIGVLGFPAFANQSFELTSPAVGWNYVTGVTGGYLIGFLLASIVAGSLSKMGFNRSNSLWANALGGLAVYLPAIAWLAIGDFGWPAEGKLLMDGMYIYLPGDILKVLGASLLVTGLWKFADNRRSGRGRSDV